MRIPRSHPRYASLMTRERIVEGFKMGITAAEGLIAQGRGEAFDYLIGETTIPEAVLAERAAAAHLLLAERPVISINGNVAVLVPEEIIALGREVGAVLEVNMFYRTGERMRRAVEHLESHGATGVLGADPDALIPGLDHERSKCCGEGIYAADVVLVPLEDGDRCRALREMGKTVVTVDLNPLSRTAGTASVTIVDNVVRAVPEVIRHTGELKGDPGECGRAIGQYDNEAVLKSVLRRVNDGLQALASAPR